MKLSLALVCIGLATSASCAERVAPPAQGTPIPAGDVPVTKESAAKVECVGLRGATGEWISGPRSKLCTVLIDEPRHDASYGKTRIVFASETGASVVHEREGIYGVLGYAPAARAFLIGGQYETGAAVFLEQLAFIDERDGALRLSSYRPSLSILSALMSPDGAALALIAAPRDDGKYKVWLYRPGEDALFELGPAPAPPPDDFECDRSYPSRWLDMIRQQGYVDMDRDVITFPSATQLRATYGRDTCRARAKRRSTRTWDLTKLGKRWEQPPERNDEGHEPEP